MVSRRCFAGTSRKSLVNSKSKIDLQEFSCALEGFNLERTCFCGQSMTKMGDIKAILMVILTGIVWR